MRQLTLKDLYRILGVKDLPGLSKEDLEWVRKSSQALLKQHGEEWVYDNRNRLLGELSYIFGDLGLHDEPQWSPYVGYKFCYGVPHKKKVQQSNKDAMAHNRIEEV